jgi:hypothetical protein
MWFERSLPDDRRSWQLPRRQVKLSDPGILRRYEHRNPRSPDIAPYPADFMRSGFIAGVTQEWGSDIQ